MSRKRRHSDEAWAHAKRVCRLSARHVEMAKKLGMNPKKLPGLVPSKSQPWKAPVGPFIEECYAKRFPAERPTTTVVEPTAPHDSDRTEDRHGLAQVENLVCYLANLSDDLEAALASGRIPSETLPRLARDLRRLADEIETGRAVPQVPYLDDFDDVPF